MRQGLRKGTPRVHGMAVPEMKIPMPKGNAEQATLAVLALGRQHRQRLSKRAREIGRVMVVEAGVGPILMGLASTAHVLTPSATVRRVVNMTAIAAVDAQIRSTRS